jgi:hypothetical protein
MWFMNLHDVAGHVFSLLRGYGLPILITAGAATLIGCALSCNCAPCKEKDSFFRREVS